MYYNGTAASATSRSPHEVVYGRKIILPGEILDHEGSGSSEFPAVEEHVRRLRQIQSITMENIEKAQRSYKSYADTRRRSTNISIGDYVLLDARNLKIKGVASRKIFPKYVGLYQVLSTSSSTYSMSHDIFNFILLLLLVFYFDGISGAESSKISF